MDTTDLDIHLALPALRQLAVTIELYICPVSHCTSSKPEQVGHALYGVIKNTESLTLAV